MTLLDPFNDVTRLKQQLDRMFDDAGAPARTGAENGRVLRPAVDVVEDADAVTVLVDLPDVERETPDVQLTGEELVIRGERKWAPPKNAACVHAERPHGQFHRSFRLGLPLQGDRVDATYKDGVLRIGLPKAESLKPRKVAVKTETDG